MLGGQVGVKLIAGLLHRKSALGGGNSTSKIPEAGLSLHRLRPHWVPQGYIMTCSVRKQTKKRTHPFKIIFYNRLDIKTNVPWAGFILYIHYYCIHFFLLIFKH